MKKLYKFPEEKRWTEYKDPEEILYAWKNIFEGASELSTADFRKMIADHLEFCWSLKNTLGEEGYFAQAEQISLSGELPDKNELEKLDNADFVAELAKVRSIDLAEQ